jgi:hypothetical protein
LSVNGHSLIGISQEEYVVTLNHLLNILSELRKEWQKLVLMYHFKCQNKRQCTMDLLDGYVNHHHRYQIL